MLEYGYMELDSGHSSGDDSGTGTFRYMIFNTTLFKIIYVSAYISYYGKCVAIY